MRSLQARAPVLASILALTLTFFPSSRKAADSVLPESSGNRSTWQGPTALGAFTHRAVGGRVVCLEARAEQARSIKDRDTNILTVLTPDSNPSSDRRTGLKVILRGTSQLQSSPAAIEAFKRAAARWETVIQTVLTVVIDLDFGPSLFDKQFDDDVVSATDAQALGGNSLYPAVRADLISGPYQTDKRSLYNSLPPGAVPTDEGKSSGSLASSATLRALDLINPVPGFSSNGATAWASSG